MPQPILKGNLDVSRWSDGIVDYVEDGRTISFWCRPTYIPNTFTYIYRPFPESWKDKHAWAGRKEEITALALDYIRTKLFFAGVVFLRGFRVREIRRQWQQDDDLPVPFGAGSP